jgi:hypothetical protein
MPQIINNFVYRVLKLVEEFFQADSFEYGSLDLTPADNYRQIPITVSGSVKKVWFSLTPYNDVYSGDNILPTQCYISESQITPSGFQFRVNLCCSCKVNWFAIM